MSLTKVVIGIIIGLILACPLFWRVLWPACVFVLGCIIWWLIFKGIKAVFFESKKRKEKKQDEHYDWQ